MENKKRFLKPEAEVMAFNNDDILAAVSGITIGDSEVPWFEDNPSNP